MARPERWAVVLWIAAGAWTAIAFLFPGLASFILFMLVLSLIGVPLAYAMMELPTVFLYLSAFAPVYLLIRRFSRPLAAIVSASIVLATMSAIPIVANRRLAAEISAYPRADSGGPVAAPANAVVALLTDYMPEIGNTQCEAYCQRLIFSGTASALLRGNTAALRDPRSPVRRYGFERSEGTCRPAPMTIAYADERDVGNLFPRPLIQHAAAGRYGEGECFLSRRASLREADIILSRTDDRGSGTRRLADGVFDPRLGARERSSRVETYRREGAGYRRVMRRSYAEGWVAAVPLRLDAPVTFDTSSPGGWRRGQRITTGREPTYGLDAFVTNDLRVTGITDAQGRPVTLRDQSR